MNNSSNNLEDRTLKFSQSVISLCKNILENTITKPLIIQLVRSSTSIGANYAEANNASSRIDFRNKIYISKKEANETKYWLKLLESSIYI
ncbi:four helix bundle protein [Candidatus Collierbacteria bacterium CG10_big_fil_rev_8_21_14_0_10_44_9]|uniref:Four helix bundle protein n=1 Tax=Candidatus Collierbacteria bacterium CG10_big_fil_rev_8_21_14_0_10_44_9 TaxID=1974535 RepID=A0A2H0VJB9_9BACT|nr:MAG: four helix bundle protein [Candidatus Collierbacteria bacterium CG10_big_fil_rev_8_21_14_0_10_44_9]